VVFPPPPGKEHPGSVTGPRKNRYRGRARRRISREYCSRHARVVQQVELQALGYSGHGGRSDAITIAMKGENHDKGQFSSRRTRSRWGLERA